MYLKNSLNSKVFTLLIDLSKKTEVSIFSGVIRNFFLKKNSVRDIDIIINDVIEIEDFFKGYEIKKNSYGGYKIFISDLKIDIWVTKNTWAYNYQKTIEYELDKYIPRTAFFNFSAVTYNLNRKEFHYTKQFLSFLQNKNLNLVYRPNGNYALCLANSIYYAEKYNLHVAGKLLNYLMYLSPRVKDNDLVDIQKKHFGSVLYTRNQIDQFLIDNLKKHHKKKNSTKSPQQTTPLTFE